MHGPEAYGRTDHSPLFPPTSTTLTPTPARAPVPLDGARNLFYRQLMEAMERIMTDNIELRASVEELQTANENLTGRLNKVEQAMEVR